MPGKRDWLGKRISLTIYPICRLIQIVWDKPWGICSATPLNIHPPGGLISVSSRREGGQVLIQVSYNGPGIPVEDQEVIFQPFCRGNNRVDQPAGMGLGLSITRDLVKAHNGRIGVESRSGLGIKFTVYLPDRNSLVGIDPPPGKEFQHEKLDLNFIQLEGIGLMEGA